MIFEDIRDKLPRHATKRFTKRTIDDIAGGCLHHTAGRDNPYNTAAYHVGPNHVSQTGAPGLLYTFYIDLKGVIYWCNDLEAVTWSQGGHGSPLAGTDANYNYMAIVCGGDFSKSEPTLLQMLSFLTLWAHLTGERSAEALPVELFDALPCEPSALWGHYDFGKPACPGPTLQAIIKAISYHADTLTTVADWQEALTAAGYPLIIDGIWGPKSAAALAAYQTAHGLIIDGVRGPQSAAHLTKR